MHNEDCFFFCSLSVDDERICYETDGCWTSCHMHLIGPSPTLSTQHLWKVFETSILCRTPAHPDSICLDASPMVSGNISFKNICTTAIVCENRVKYCCLWVCVCGGDTLVIFPGTSSSLSEVLLFSFCVCLRLTRNCGQGAQEFKRFSGHSVFFFTASETTSKRERGDWKGWWLY